MNPSETKRLWRENVLPIFLSNGWAAHRLSCALYHRYSVASFVCSRKQHLLDLLDPTSRFFRLYGEEYSSLYTEQLLDLARDAEGCLLLLIPVTDKDRQFLSEAGSPLAHHYILTDGQALLKNDLFTLLKKESTL